MAVRVRLSSICMVAVLGISSACGSKSESHPAVIKQVGDHLMMMMPAAKGQWLFVELTPANTWVCDKSGSCPKVDLKADTARFAESECPGPECEGCDCRLKACSKYCEPPPPWDPDKTKVLTPHHFGLNDPATDPRPPASSN